MSRIGSAQHTGARAHGEGWVLLPARARWDVVARHGVPGEQSSQAAALPIPVRTQWQGRAGDL